MLQTLLRIRFDQTWPLGPLGDVPVWGLGVLLALWAVVGLAWYLLRVRKTGWQPDYIGFLTVWGVIGVVILVAPSVGTRLAPAGIPVFGYGFMLFLGFIAGGWTAARRARSVGLDGELIWDLAMWLFFLGIVGARVFHLIQYHERIFAGKSGFELLKAAINLPDGGLVLYGGVIAAIAGYIWFCRRRKLDALLLADVAIPSVFLGVSLGRIGCLLNGCCYGDRCELPWAITFPKDSVPYIALVKRGFLDPDAPYSLPLHPTQIYSSIDALVLCLLTAAYFRYRHKNGAVLALGWLMYPITRFCIEYVRGDELGKFNTSLTISQWVSIGLFLSGLVYTAWLYRRPARGVENHPASPAPRGAHPA